MNQLPELQEPQEEEWKLLKGEKWLVPQEIHWL
jgi:hypothetical protein